MPVSGALTLAPACPLPYPAPADSEVARQRRQAGARHRGTRPHSPDPRGPASEGAGGRIAALPQSTQHCGLASGERGGVRGREGGGFGGRAERPSRDSRERCRRRRAFAGISHCVVAAAVAAAGTGQDAGLQRSEARGRRSGRLRGRLWCLSMARNRVKSSTGAWRRVTPSHRDTTLHPKAAPYSPEVGGLTDTGVVSAALQVCSARCSAALQSSGAPARWPGGVSPAGRRRGQGRREEGVIAAASWYAILAGRAQGHSL